MSNMRSQSSDSTQARDASADDSSTTTQVASPLILSLDTSTGVRSIAIARGERVIACTSGQVRKENSASVLQDIDEALNAAKVALDDIELFAVATGPGSFTGLRSGIATIKAFAATLNRPVAGVPTLHAIASACAPARRVLASLPAGRGELFAQLLSVDGENVIEELSGPVHLSPASLLEKAAQWGGDLTWAGAGAHAHAAAISAFAAEREIAWRDETGSRDELTLEQHAVWSLAPEVESYAEEIAAHGLIKYRQGSTIMAEDLSALYVRLSDAELNERCRV